MNPLQAPAPVQLPLGRAPLDRVVFQVKFQPVFSIGRPEFIGPFQEQIRARYPRASEPSLIRIQFKWPGSELPAGPLQAQPEYQFADEEQRWKVTLAQDFLALQTKAYNSRDEFLERLAEVLQALETHIRPSQCTRLGIRYIDRIKDLDDLRHVKSFFRPEVLGLAFSSDTEDQMRQVFSESLMPTREGRLFARWGLLPANTTYDPFMVEALKEESWILDLDSFTEDGEAFNAASVVSQATALAERSYTFFRWSITDAFVKHFR